MPTRAAGLALAPAEMAAASVWSPAPNGAGSSQAPACQGRGGGTGWLVHAHAYAHMCTPGQRGRLQLEGCLPGQGQAGRREAGKQPELVCRYWGTPVPASPGPWVGRIPPPLHAPFRGGGSPGVAPASVPRPKSGPGGIRAGSDPCREGSGWSSLCLRCCRA